HRGRVLAVGDGDLLGVEYVSAVRKGPEARLRGQQFVFFMRESFSWKSPNPISCVSFRASARVDTPAVMPDYSPAGGTGPGGGADGGTGGDAGTGGGGKDDDLKEHPE